LTAANQLHILVQAIAGTAMNLSAAPATEKTISHGIIENVEGVTDVVLRAMSHASNSLGFKQGYKALISQVFVDDDERLESDVVFGVTKDLIGHYLRHEANETPPAPDVKAPSYTFENSFVMQPGGTKRPIPPIK